MRSELAVVGRAYASGAGASSAWRSKFSIMRCETSLDSGIFFGSTQVDVVFIAGSPTTRHCNSRTTSGRLSWAGSMSLKAAEIWRRRLMSVCPTVLCIHHSSESTSLENVIDSGELNEKKMSASSSCRSALQIARSEFKGLVLQNQDCFAGEEQTNVLLELLGDADMSARLRRKWSDADKSSEEKWDDVLRERTPNSVSIVFPLFFSESFSFPSLLCHFR